MNNIKKQSLKDKIEYIIPLSFLVIFGATMCTLLGIDVAKTDKARELESKVDLVENKLNHKVDNLETSIIVQSSAIKYSFVDLFAKDCFVEWLELQSLDTKPYYVISIEYAKTDGATFGYEYYTATVYYTTGEVKSKKYLFGFDPKERTIVQIVEII